MKLQSIELDPPVGGTDQIEILFLEIDKKARTSGKAEFVMMLDRVPGALVGSENTRDNERTSVALANAFEVLLSVSKQINDQSHKGQ